MQRVVDLSSDGLHVTIHRGFLIVSQDNQRVGQVALDDIAGVIAHAHGLTWSNTAFTKLAERGVPVVLCAQNHAPVACVWPLQGHHLQGARLRAQSDASKPLAKRLWRDIVISKVRMQGAVLESVGQQAGAFERMARAVRSGDPGNIEAQAARRYWPLLMGAQFRRDQAAGGSNAMLNYGYTVLRATVSRAICGAGLHPGVGVFHANRTNAFALADDLMEPYRPLVDRAVFNLVSDKQNDVSSSTKRALASLIDLDLPATHGQSPLHVHTTRLAQSLVSVFTGQSTTLDLPKPLDPLILAGLARGGTQR